MYAMHLVADKGMLLPSFLYTALCIYFLLYIVFFCNLVIFIKGCALHGPCFPLHTSPIGLHLVTYIFQSKKGDKIIFHLQHTYFSLFVVGITQPLPKGMACKFLRINASIYCSHMRFLLRGSRRLHGLSV